MSQNNTAPLASPFPFHDVLITGASAGIGAALAQLCAGPDIRLHLCARDATRLEMVAAICRAKGALVFARCLDVGDAAGMADWIEGVGRLDLVIANAGIGAGSDDGRPENAVQVRRVLATNLDGALNTVLPAMAMMQAQAPNAQGVRGHIAAIASIAAFVPGPGAATYCAAKAALDRWMVATAHLAAGQGIVMSSICPGYVRTPLTAANKFPMPGLMDADRAALIILRGITRGVRRLAFPWWVAGMARLVGALPPRVSTWILSRPPGKAAMLAD
jgi:NAD(P)-dependent dehydrogenase (short-subunit alcohol dehydrogenase family)